MSQEFQHIVSLAAGLSRNELFQLMQAIDALTRQKDVEDAREVPDEEKELLRARLAKIDSGESRMRPWEEVKARVFGKK